MMNSLLNAMAGLLGVLLLCTTPISAAELSPVIKGGCSAATAKGQCEMYSASLRDEWPKALKGDFVSMRKLVFCSQTGCDGAMKPDMASSCGWLLVILGASKADANDKRNYRDNCLALPPETKSASIKIGDNRSRSILKKPLPLNLD